MGLVSVLVAALVTPPAQAIVETPELVTADVETVPVSSPDDAADDPAIWVHPTDPGSSLVIGNDKGGALETYDLDGSLHERITTSTTFWGNVDLRQGATVGASTLDVVAVQNSGLRLFAVDLPTRSLVLVTDGTGTIPTGGGEGLCLYDSPATGDLYVFVITIEGRLRQYLVQDQDGDGLLEATMVRELVVGSESEGCVADEATGALYVSEEDVGLWRYGAMPGTGAARTLVDEVQPAGHLAADVEGTTLVRLAGGAGYLIASAQNVADPDHSYFVVYDRQTNAYVKSFRVVDGQQADGCERTDGVAAHAGDLGPLFPSGLFVCQDNDNKAPGVGLQDFKLVRLEKVVDLSPGGGNVAPAASFTASCEGLSCSFDGSGSTDSDGLVEGYAWSFGDGGTDVGVTSSHTYSSAGTRTVTLTVTDDGGAAGSTTRQVSPTSGDVSFVGATSANGNKSSHTVRIPGTVQAGDALVLFFVGNTNTPTITGPPGWALLRQGATTGAVGRLWWRVATAADAGSVVTVSGSGSLKADLTVAAYRGTAAEPVTGSAIGLDTTARTTHLTPTVPVAQGGSWVLSYWADKSAASTSWTLPPSLSRRSATTGTGSGHITAALADSGSPAPLGTGGGLSATTGVSSNKAVMFTVVMAASSPGGGNVAPAASFTASCEGLSCSFDGSGSTDSDGLVEGYAWSFGDGGTDVGVTSSHTYSSAGTRTVTLTVTDDGGAAGSTTRQVSPTSGDVSFVGATSANGNKSSHTVRIPGTVQAGDALVLFFVGNTNTPTITGPPGWALLRQGATTGAVGRLWWRVATAADAGSVVTVSGSGSLKADLTVAAYRGTAAEPVTGSAIGLDTTARTTHLTPTVPVAQGGSWVLSYWADKSAASTSWTLPPSLSRRSATTGTGSGHITAALADSGSPAPLGTGGGLSATTGVSSNKAVMFTVAVAAGSPAGSGSTDSEVFSARALGRTQ